MSSTPNNQENSPKEPPKEAPKPQPTTTKLNHTPDASYAQTRVARFDGYSPDEANFQDPDNQSS